MIAYLITILVLVSIAAIIGLGLNIQWGLTGLVNFGVVGFFSLGAYTASLISIAGLGTFTGMAAAALISAVFSCGLALLAIRLSENYLAIVTLGFGEAIRLVLLNEAWLTGGALGISGIPRPFDWAFSTDAYSYVFLAICLGMLALAFVLCQAVAHSPLGRVLRAVRDDDAVAAGLGKNVLRLRIVAFGFGGALMGVAGSLHAYYLTYIDPSQFTAIVTAYAFMAVIAGGRGSNQGLILGAGAIMILFEATRFLKDFVSFVDSTQLAALRLGMIGLGIILLLIYRPGGLMTEPRLTPDSIPRRKQTGPLAPMEV